MPSLPGTLDSMRKLLPVALILAAGCQAAPPAVPQTGQPRTDTSIAWAPCGPRECATLEVPLDHARPQGERITLALTRMPARDPGKRLGSLVFNPGGPGATGLDFPRVLTRAHDTLGERYDLIGYDPRGVGESSPVRCLTKEDLAIAFAADPTPDTDREKDDAFAAARKVATACEKAAGPLLPYLGTRNHARDLDRIRQALGEDKLTAFGLSWGGSLMATYADLFPGKVGRLVLDSPGNPTLSQFEVIRLQMAGTEKGLRRFADACGARADCPIGATGEEVLERFDRFLDRGLPVGELTEPAARLAVLYGLYRPDGWPKLENALAKAYKGDGRPMLEMSAWLAGGSQESGFSNFQDANMAVNCADYTERYGRRDLDRLAAKIAVDSPRFGPSSVWQTLLNCAYWPKSADPHAGRLSGAGAPPILIVGNTGDPDGVYEYASDLAGQLSSARLLTWDGDRHGAYGGKNACVDAAVDAYLLKGALPGPGSRCR
ncbi:alpha/beta hydrolase [Nonomuraea endophytica]|uniref:Pimeloyl-ACP methyl ester carboxylesterase n=1 Tax=Nonomuraea endophytica TaxID=714136 RepID=A0A7W7ZX88_9ACTN|nr:alpha/beta hydrolase [Nonomuraea endophytica]MBB5074583.1 pimeloyl-ACP methyl ester carboxylesterase [Nonomuraea endophytica]